MSPDLQQNVPSRIESDPITVGAGFGIRLVARLIDTIFTIILGLLAGLALGILCGILAAAGKLAPDWQQHLNVGLLGSLLIGLVASLAYHTLSEGIGGVSLGKLLCGLRVVQRDGSPCTLQSALERSVGYFLDGLFFGLVGYSAMSETRLRQRYGDRWAETVVVERDQVPTLPKLDGGFAAAGILSGSFAWLALHLALYLIHLLNSVD